MDSTASCCSLSGMNRWLATSTFCMAFNDRITQIACAILFVAGAACLGYLLYQGGYDVSSPEFLASLIGASLGALGLKIALLSSLIFTKTQEVPLKDFENCKEYGTKESDRMQVRYFVDGKETVEKSLPSFAGVKKYTGAEIFVDVMMLAQRVYGDVAHHASENVVNVKAVRNEVVCIEAFKKLEIFQLSEGEKKIIAYLNTTTAFNFKTGKVTLSLGTPTFQPAS